MNHAPRFEPAPATQQERTALGESPDGTLYALLDLISDAVIWIDAGALVRFANRAAVSMLNASPGEAVPLGILDRAARGIIAGHITLPHAFDFNIGEHAADSDHFTAQWTASPGSQGIFLVIQTDTRAQVHGTVVRNFLGLLQHDQLKPMNAVARAATMLASKLKGVQQADPAMRVEIDSLACDLETLATRFSKLAELVSAFGGEPLEGQQRVPLPDILLNVVKNNQALALQYGVKVSLGELPAHLPVIYCSEKWLTRSIEEILASAIRQSLRDSVLLISVTGGDTFVRIVITNGAVSPALRYNQRNIELFSKRPENERHDASGLGLGLARQIIELHGGNLRYRADDDHNVSITVEMPLGSPLQQPAAADAEQAVRYAADLANANAIRRPPRMAAGKELQTDDAPIRGRGKHLMKILVVDDQKDFRRLINMTLGFLDYEIFEAGNGRSGLLMAKQILPDAMLVDVMMRGEIDGIQLCGMIKAAPELRHIRVLMLSSRAEQADLDTGMTAGADGYLTKPFSPLELIDTLHRLCPTGD